MKKTITILSMILILTMQAACAPAATPTPVPAQPTMNETVVAEAVNATTTAQAALNPTLTAVPPSPTLEPSPTTPLPTSTQALQEGDPALELGEPSGVDTFDSAINFAPMATMCFVSEIAGGQFVMAANGVAGIYCWTTSWPQIQDFYIETTTVMPDVCAAGDQFGLLFRSPDSSSGYLFSLSCAGKYSLKRVTGGSVTDLIAPTSSEVILTNGGEIESHGCGSLRRGLSPLC